MSPVQSRVPAVVGYPAADKYFYSFRISIFFIFNQIYDDNDKDDDDDNYIDYEGLTIIS